MSIASEHESRIAERQKDLPLAVTAPAVIHACLDICSGRGNGRHERRIKAAPSSESKQSSSNDIHNLQRTWARRPSAQRKFTAPYGVPCNKKLILDVRPMVSKRDRARRLVFFDGLLAAVMLCRMARIRKDGA